MAQTVRIAVWGKPEDMNTLRPQRRRDAEPITEDDYDETGLAEEMASFGFVEVPRT